MKNLARPSAAMTFVILLGFVSLFADMTYEGARAVTGPYLAILGASATVVGIVAGFGELIGYALRLVSGYLSDRTEKYWLITIAGYVINLLAVPLLALAGAWQIAALLIVAERAGKAIRTPARDAMLSHATQEMGRGWGFGLHEAMDQIGALLGPLLVAGALYVRHEYRTGFVLLLVPALLSLTVLVAARVLYPNPRDLEVSVPQLDTHGLPRVYWLYLAAVALVAAGFADWALVAYHFEKQRITSETAIPLFYAAGMVADAIAALVFGRWFDRAGLAVLILATLLSALFAPLVFLGGAMLAFLGVLLWGVGMGAHESIMRAAVAGMAPARRRGSAYGIFNTGYGIAWFLGSALMGALYDRSLAALIAFSVLAQLAALPLLYAVMKQAARVPPGVGEPAPIG
jgi:MFS family permease